MGRLNPRIDQRFDDLERKLDLLVENRGTA
jgi:hypothetical protein